MTKLEGKTALITGGNSGIGLATAQRFAAEGAYVFITGRRRAELDAAVKQIGRNVTDVQGDVANPADLDRLYAAVRKEKGRVDVLFANAGAGELLPLGEITEEHLDRIFDVNVNGLLFTVQKALPLFTERGGSNIFDSLVVPTQGFPALSVYNASQAAPPSFARPLTPDTEERQIKGEAVQPRPG